MSHAVPAIPFFIRRAVALYSDLVYFLILRFRLRVGKFVPDVYLKQVVGEF